MEKKIQNAEQKSSGPFSRMETDELFREYRKTGELEIKQELTMRYLYIVKSIALQMKNIYSGFAQLDDIIDEGVIVLMTSIDKFDVDKNVKFSTFVSKRIRGMIIDMARVQDWVPRGVRKTAMEIDNATHSLFALLGRFPTDQEMADHMGVSLEKYEKMLQKSHMYYMISLDMMLEEGPDNSQTFQITSGRTSEQPEKNYMEKEMKKILQEGIEGLTQNEKTVLALHYAEDLSAKEIAGIMHISAPRVSQIHANILRKLRIYIEQKNS